MNATLVGRHSPGRIILPSINEHIHVKSLINAMYVVDHTSTQEVLEDTGESPTLTWPVGVDVQLLYIRRSSL